MNNSLVYSHFEMYDPTIQLQITLQIHIERSHTESQNACMLVVPTGVAAFNIGGLTIHYAFWLPVEYGNLTRYTQLSAERLHQFRLLCKDANTIIIDEIGMISYKTLGFIYQQLTEIKGTDDTEVYFGGLSIIAVGGFYQLPPVRDRFVFHRSIESNMSW